MSRSGCEAVRDRNSLSLGSHYSFLRIEYEHLWLILLFWRAYLHFLLLGFRREVWLLEISLFELSKRLFDKCKQ